MLMIASSESVRQQNRALVLVAMRTNGAISHTEIAEWTSLSSATVSAITADLESENIILRQEQSSKTGRGRPRVLFQQNPDAAYIAAIRITSESVECSLSDYAGTMKDRFEERRPPSETDTSTFQQRIKASLERLAERSDLSKDRILTISITSKGVVANTRPVLMWSPVFGDEKIDFEKLLRPDWQARILLTNETQFAAQAIGNENNKQERVFSTRKMATLSLGHSIGLGISTQEPNGRVTSIAPSFGHMVHHTDGPLCRCGEQGCIEAYAGFYGLLRTAFEAPENSIPAKFVPLQEIEKIADAARRGDRMAERAFRLAGEAIGMGLSRLHTLFEPMPVTIIGQGIYFYDLMREPLEEAMKKNLLARSGSTSEITLRDDQSTLVYNGNIEACLTDLDTGIIAGFSTEKALK